MLYPPVQVTLRLVKDLPDVRTGVTLNPAARSPTGLGASTDVPRANGISTGAASAEVNYRSVRQIAKRQRSATVRSDRNVPPVEDIASDCLSNEGMSGT